MYKTEPMTAWLDVTHNTVSTACRCYSILHSMDTVRLRIKLWYLLLI